jgi:hypothetical protein
MFVSVCAYVVLCCFCVFFVVFCVYVILRCFCVCMCHLMLFLYVHVSSCVRVILRCFCVCVCHLTLFWCVHMSSYAVFVCEYVSLCCFRRGAPTFAVLCTPSQASNWKRWPLEPAAAAAATCISWSVFPPHLLSVLCELWTHDAPWTLFYKVACHVSFLYLYVLYSNSCMVSCIE